MIQRRVKEERELVLLIPHSQGVWTVQSSDWTIGVTVRTQTCFESGAPAIRERSGPGHGFPATDGAEVPAAL